jgi:hypothetical protein
MASRSHARNSSRTRLFARVAGLAASVVAIGVIGLAVVPDPATTSVQPLKPAKARAWYARHRKEIGQLRETARDARDEISTALTTGDLDPTTCAAFLTPAQRLGTALPISGAVTATGVLRAAIFQMGLGAMGCQGLSYDLQVAADAEYISGAQSNVTPEEQMYVLKLVNESAVRLNTALRAARLPIPPSKPAPSSSRSSSPTTTTTTRVRYGAMG